MPHDLNLAARFADRIYVLHRGKVAREGAPHQTITKQMLRDVFEVNTEIGSTEGAPHVLPQAIML